MPLIDIILCSETIYTELNQQNVVIIYIDRVKTFTDSGIYFLLNATFRTAPERTTNYFRFSSCAKLSPMKCVGTIFVVPSFPIALR